MKKRSEVGLRAIRKRIARVVGRRASQAGCADWSGAGPVPLGRARALQHAQFALQTAEHPEGACPPARPGVLLLSATAVACS